MGFPRTLQLHNVNVSITVKRTACGFFHMSCLIEGVEHSVFATAPSCLSISAQTSTSCFTEAGFVTVLLKIAARQAESTQ